MQDFFFKCKSFHELKVPGNLSNQWFMADWQKTMNGGKVRYLRGKMRSKTDMQRIGVRYWGINKTKATTITTSCTAAVLPESSSYKQQVEPFIAGGRHILERRQIVVI